MRKKGFSKWLLALMLVFLLVLAACGGDDNDGNASNGGDDNNSTENNENNDEGNNDEGNSEGNDEGDEGDAFASPQPDEEGVFSIEDFQTAAPSGEGLEDGTLTYGLVSDTVFEGTLNWNFYSGAPDAEVIGWFDEALLGMDANYTYTQDGAATFEVEDGRIFTFTIRDNVNWHDGEPVTAEDWAFAHEVIAHPEYPGVRYSGSMTNIEGIEEYHNGEADSISGIEVLNEKQLKITYKDSTPALLTGGIWPYALAKHIFGDMEVAEMEESDAVRKNPIGFGPYEVDTITPGESVTYVRNDDYWRGTPGLAEVTLRVIAPETVVNELETGGVDMVDGFPTDQFLDNYEMSNVNFLGDIDLAYTYIGFKLGTWDHEAGEVAPDPDKKMADVNLRRAMWYAVDNNAVGDRFYNGLRWNATTLIVPSHPAYHDDSIETPTYDPDEANRILDEAGYEDVDGDGIREDKDGEPLVINFASMSGGDTAEPLAQYYIQRWADVGLKVELIDGRLLEFNSFYDRVGQKGEDDPEIDIYQGAWGVGSDVDPSGLYGRNAMFNFPRYASEENDRLLAEGLSEEAFDVEYRQSVYSEWQELMAEEIPVFPTLYRALVIPVNKRVVNYDMSAGSDTYLYQLAVTEEEPVVAE
ncbi:oligopeptide ABC transporter substrate-binding protein [Ornithinibacillus halophilus]|uniref:Peptide/nickel transport system substrate-binding protein n=1 Tax=Ornithinibacillus halophilus TaxID=930117 RepID=A0A1M5IBU5_9BACI|nr:oligopeptide ABC transporter substrate-binding protein [Ornithinibacillus halophilus]SHG25707.1 peptide/nickel transport system substrate-binding protein [Ornithinibacillus halophilus]